MAHMLRIRYVMVAVLFIGVTLGQSPAPASNSTAAQPQPDATSSVPANTLPDSTQLEPIETVQAVYPGAARDKNIQGQVVVMILVSEAGGVESTNVARGDALLRDAAVDAAKRWRFKPFIQNGEPVAAIASLSFDFESPAGEHSDSADNWLTKATLDKARSFPKSIRVSSGVIKAMMLKRVGPNYPEAAKRARIQGSVALRGVIGTDGKVKDIAVISGPPELVDEAVKTVQQWLYKPYLFMGRLVDVQTDFVVNFTLNGG